MAKNSYRIIIGVVIFVVGLGIGFSLNRITSTQTTSNKSTTSSMTFTSPKHTKQSAQRLFINASMNTNGNTNKLGKKLFGGLSYQQVNLADEKIPQVGQGEGDFTTVFNRMKKADVIVIGTPVYWSNMSGYLKTLIDHMQINNDLKGADLYVLVQGADSNQAAAIASTYASLNRISKRFGLNFVGIASTDTQVTKLHDQMIGK